MVVTVVTPPPRVLQPGRGRLPHPRLAFPRPLSPHPPTPAHTRVPCVSPPRTGVKGTLPAGNSPPPQSPRRNDDWHRLRLSLAPGVLLGGRPRSCLAETEAGAGIGSGGARHRVGADRALRGNAPDFHRKWDHGGGHLGSGFITGICC